MPTGQEKLFESLAPAGHYVAIRVGFAFPVHETNLLPEKWVAFYTSRGLMLSDPVMHWVYQNDGAARWSDIRLEDPRNVFEQASSHGLRYGVAISCVESAPPGQRSFGVFCRSDREFKDAEIASLHGALSDMHDAMVPPTNLTRAELEALKMVKNGLLMKEIANLLNVSEGAVKLRLRNAKAKLKAKTSTQAATLATSFGLI